MKKYTVRTSCEIAGVWRDAGAEITLSDAQARELTPPFGRVVLPVADPVVATTTPDPIATVVTNRAIITPEANDVGISRSKRNHRGGVK
jgi:hypothetical protein